MFIVDIFIVFSIVIRVWEKKFFGFMDRISSNMVIGIEILLCIIFMMCIGIYD